MHGSIEFAVHGQIRSLVGKLLCQFLVDLNSQARFFTGMHAALLEVISMGKNFVSLSRMAHVLLNAEVVDAQIKMQGRRHAHRTEVGGPVRAGTHLVEFGQGGDLLEMSDSTGMDNCGADIVDELLLNQSMAIVDR